MKNFEIINVTPEVRRCFERSSIISDIFEDECVRTAYVMLAILIEPESSVSKCLLDRGIRPIPGYIIKEWFENKVEFEKVFGKKGADKFFYEPSNETLNTEETTTDSDFKEKEAQSNNSEEIKKAVEEAIIGLFAEGYEEWINLEVSYSDKLEAICEDAATRCILSKQNYLDIDNLTYSVLQNENSSGYKLLKTILDSVNEGYALGVSVNDVIEYLLVNANIHLNSNENEDILVIPKNLENCCTVLNAKFKPGVKSDILGRDDEIFKLWNIFSKRTKRNAILLGEAGVGKTAIVEAMVQEIVNGTCPEQFKDYTVLELDVGATVAGTKYRGELEEKLAKLKKFLETTSNIILFVDEMHQLIGAGSSENSAFDMSGALKPLLARGDVVFVGATTTEEYNRFIKKEQAFKRRFEPVIVNEPKHCEVAEMIKAKVENLSLYHDVTLKEGLLDYIIVCASAFNLTATNPDKSIDLCDRSMAIAKMRGSKVVEKCDVDKVHSKNYLKLDKWSTQRKKIIAYHEAGHYVMSQLTSLKYEENVIAVSIVPGEDFLGAYIYDVVEDVLQPTYSYYMDKIKACLAGRIAQEMFCNAKDDAGARNDLEKATLIAKSMITDFAISQSSEFGNLHFESTKDLYSEDLKEKLHEKCRKIIESATNEVREIFLEGHVGLKIRAIADLLLKKKIVTAEELKEVFYKM